MDQPIINEIRTRLRDGRSELEAEIERQLEIQQARFRYRLHRGRVRFEADVRALQRQYRIGLLPYIARARLGYVLTAPLIYGLVVPLALLDLFVTVYQQVCFRVYGIARVRRGDHVIIDRHHLAYLNGIEKLNCVYCGYANGVIAYARDIAARTEAHWCPIKHARRPVDPHDRFEDFLDYGDAESYRDWLEDQRKAITPPS